MNLFAGLEKFGLAPKEELNILDEPKKKSKQSAEVVAVKEEPKETDFLLDKTITCPVCDQTFKVKAVKSARAKRMEPDFDLRPNYEYIDVLKYDVCVCPHCGYGAMNRFFDKLSTAQMRIIRKEVCSKFRPQDQVKMETYSYDYAVDNYKLSLMSTIAKHGKLSEKAYTCLKIAWLRRTQLENLKGETAEEQKLRAQYQVEFDAFYQQAYEGFIKVLSTEVPPFCGMDANTIEFMLANMSMYFKKYDVASKLVANLLTSPTVPSRMKDKTLEIKQQILEEIRKAPTQK